jgi:hypothetical protein
MPKWCARFYWICPVAWMLYGIISSQLGDVDTPFHTAGFGAQIMVEDFITSYLGYHYDWLICVVAVCISFCRDFLARICVCMQSSSWTSNIGHRGSL